MRRVGQDGDKRQEQDYWAEIGERSRVIGCDGGWGHGKMQSDLAGWDGAVKSKANSVLVWG